MSTLSTHVLDTSLGRPAAGMSLQLERWGSEGWQEIGRGQTDSDGRVRDLLQNPDEGLLLGRYRMSFDTGAYHSSQGVEGFYPLVQVEFQVRAEDEHYHVPLLISPFGFSTYRGS